MIEFKNLCKSFGDKVVFKDFNLTIDNGAFAVIMGESGCGKTTLINMLGGIEKADSGSIIVDGTDISQKKNLIKYFRETVGFLFQNFALIDNKTVMDNLKLVKKSVRSDVTIEQALEFVGLANVLDKKVYMLSGGEQQRVALARLLIKKCSIILADEPTGSLDRNNADKVIALLKEMNSRGKTIVMVSHDDRFKTIGSQLINLQVYDSSISIPNQ